MEAPRRALAVFAASYVLCTGLSVHQEALALSARQTLLFTTLAYLATTVVPGLDSRYRTQRRTLLHALHEHNAQLLREREIIASHVLLRASITVELRYEPDSLVVESPTGRRSRGAVAVGGWWSVEARA